MSNQPSATPDDERLFLRDIVSKPFDAVTCMEFMTLWGIANRVAASETALNTHPALVYLMALAYADGHFDGDPAEARIKEWIEREQPQLPDGLTIAAAIDTALSKPSAIAPSNIDQFCDTQWVVQFGDGSLAWELFEEKHHAEAWIAKNDAIGTGKVVSVRVVPA